MENQPPGEGSGASDVAEQSSDSTVHLNIKTLDSRTFSFHVDENILVLDFKEKIASQVDVPTGQQRLIFRGKVLKDDHRLSEYNVEHGDTLHLVKRQPLPPPGPNTGDTTSSNSTGGVDPSAGGTHNRILGQTTRSVVLRTLNIRDPGPEEAVVLSAQDWIRVFGLLSSIAGDTHPGVQNPHGNETEQSQSQTNAGSQSQGGIQFGPSQVGQSGSNPMQSPAGVAIPVPTLNMPVPDSLNTLTEFMNGIELALSQNGTQENQSPTASGTPTPEFPVNSFGFPTVEALTTVLRHAQRLLSNHVVPTLSRTAGRLDQEGGSSDSAVRTQVQMESVRLGFTMEDLGALFLELARTVSTLRLRPSPGESFVSAGPSVYISPYGPNDIMLQVPGVTQNHVPVGNVTRNVNIHIHSGASLAHLVPVNVIGNRAPNVEEMRGQQVNEAPDLSSVSTSVPQINAQLRNLAANMQSGNHASSGGLSNQEQPAGGGIRDEETTQTSGMAKNDTSTAPDEGSQNRSSMSGPSESLEGPSGPSQGNSNQDGSSVVPLGLGLGGLQPNSLASPSSRGGENPPTFSGQPSHPSRNVLGNLPTARQNSNNDNIDIADAMSQALGGSSLDDVLARLSQQTGIGSPDMLRNILQQFTQDPAMRNTMNQMAQGIDAQHFESVFSGVESQGGDFNLTRMIQQMMPIVSQALGSMSQHNPPPGEGLLENSSRRGVGSTYDNTQIDLRQVTRIEHQGISENILRYVIDRGLQLSRGDESFGSALCISALAQEFMDMLILGLSGRLEDGM